TPFDEEEREIIAKGLKASENAPPKELESFLETGVAPWNDFAPIKGYSTEMQTFLHPAFNGWDACPEGRLVVYSPAGRRKLTITFDEIRNNADGNNKLRCEAVIQGGISIKGGETVVDGNRSCSVELPATERPQLVDFLWRFDRFTCSSPYSCYAAHFLSLL